MKNESKEREKKRDPLRKNARSEKFRETELTKEFYKIQEVSEFIGVPATTIRFWEKNFEEIRPVRSMGNVRYYTPDMISKIRMIHFLIKVKGMRIEAAREQLRTNRHNISRRMDAIEGLQEVRTELTYLLKTMEKRR